MINIIITENEMPTYEELKTKREKLIAPQAQNIANEAIKEISATLKDYFRGTYDIMKSESDWFMMPNAMTLDELAELAEEIAKVFEKQGFKTEIQTFCPNYKVFRRIHVSI